MSLLALLDAVPCAAGAGPGGAPELRESAGSRSVPHCTLSRSWWRIMGGRTAEPLQGFRDSGLKQHLCRADSA